MLKLYNYLSRKIEDFKPIGAKVGLYTCGPTVYDSVHIGNWRTFVFEDVLKRVLNFNGFKVKHIMNITDIDDKIIKKSQAEKKPINELTKEYEDTFLQDLSRLNIVKAHEYTRATEHIGEMIDLIKRLVERGIAYEKDGSVYFSIFKFKDYGKLSGTNVKGVKAGARVDVDEYEKDNPQDFALWKKEDEEAKKRHEAWDSPWGIGRPGWHIECSAMSMKYLGESFDIHAGGVDLLFPHHENEIAQSEGATGKKFVNFWVEGEHLLVDSQKMAKRLGNIFTLADIVKKAMPAGRQGFDPIALRYLFLTAHYRSTLNFTWESLEAAQNTLDSIRYQVLSIKYQETGAHQSDDFLNRFGECINSDLDMPRAIAILHETLKSDLSDADKYATVLQMDKVLGLGLDQLEKAELPEGAKKLIEEREKLRSQGEFEESDKVREELAKMGVEVEDTPEGSKWKIKR